MLGYTKSNCDSVPDPPDYCPDSTGMRMDYGSLGIMEFWSDQAIILYFIEKSPKISDYVVLGLLFWCQKHGCKKLGAHTFEF
jgi:hypothetical protein